MKSRRITLIMINNSNPTSASKIEFDQVGGCNSISINLNLLNFKNGFPEVSEERLDQR